MAPSLASPNEAPMAVCSRQAPVQDILLIWLHRGAQEGPGVIDLPEYDPKVSSAQSSAGVVQLLRFTVLPLS